MLFVGHSAKGQVPREININNRKQLVPKIFNTEAQKHDIKPIFGRQYNPLRT